MGDDSEAIERALVELASLVATQLQEENWVRRDIGRGRVLVLTRAVGGGVFASVEVLVASSRGRQRWPETLDVEFGAGYEPALGLLPLVTLDPEACLVSGPGVPDWSGLSVEISGIDQIATIATTLVQAIRDRGVGFAEQYDVDAFLAALTGGEQWSDDREAELRPVVLAAAGRAEEARSELESYLAGDSEESRGRDYQRFARQLRRWLDGGNSEIPPVEETLRRLPPSPRPERPSWSRSRQDARDQAAARDAVRAAARGKTRGQISDLLATEYAVRGLHLSPSELALTAESIELEQQPLGGLRMFLRGMQTLTSIGADAVGLVRDRGRQNPSWMQPPPRAAYRIRTGDPHVAVVLDEGADPVLSRAAREGTRRLGPIVRVDLWLTRADPQARVRVHLGEHEVGTLPTEATSAFAADLRVAAELYDEDVCVGARLVFATAGSRPLLEVGVTKLGT